MAACSSTENKSSMQYYLYPQPIARFEDIIANPKLFMGYLGNFHAAMGTKFMIPIVGGKDLDLHRLFVEVTSRGSIKKVLEEKKWKEVTNSFSFPPSATNASFILRKYYMSLIHHFEQVYYFKAKAWTPVSGDTWKSTKHTLTSTSGMDKALLPLPEFQMDPTQVMPMNRQRAIIEDSLPKASPEQPIGFPVSGTIHGKFENGYLCTVMIGGEQLQGVLYQPTVQPSFQTPKHQSLITQYQTTSANVTSPLTMVRRRRRKKCEMKKRDPAHPKPNRSGYNFFFAEQHARLKPLHPGKDRDISRMIGELWNSLTESNRVVYQEKAMKDKERYKTEMEHYRETLKTKELVSNAAPLLQHMFNDTPEIDVVASPQTPKNELSSTCSDKMSFQNEVKSAIGGEACSTDFEMNINISNHDEETHCHEPKLPYTRDETEAKYQFIVEFDGTAEHRIADKPRSLKQLVDVNENIDQEHEIFQKNDSKVTNDGVEINTEPNELESFS